MKVKFFTQAGGTPKDLEDEINEWIEKLGSQWELLSIEHQMGAVRDTSRITVMATYQKVPISV